MSPTPAASRRERRPNDDARLIRDVLAGEEGSFLYLAQREHASMIRYAGLFVSAGEAVEVVRDAWRRILTGLAQYDGSGTLRSWMFGIVAICANSHRNPNFRLVPSAALAEEAKEDGVEADRFFPPGSQNAGAWRKLPKPWPEDYARRYETLECVRESVQRLSPLRRQVMFLRDVEGWSTGEVSALLGITDRQQRLLLHCARLRIRADLERHFTD